MKKLAKYARCLLGASILCMFIFTTVVILQPTNWKLYAPTILSLCLLTTILFVAARKKLKAALLITENQILYIKKSAVFCEREHNKESKTHPYEPVEVYVSCFGILLGSKIIKFNQKGIQLKAVEIGCDCICLDYGNDSYTRTIRLLHNKLENSAIADIIEKFRYETGIIPTIKQ